jgi:transaldolase
MQFFLDTANVEEIRSGMEWGLVDGVTTNPSLVSKENRPFESLIREICQIVDGPVSVEAVSQTAKEMIQEGKGLAGIHENVVVKIPMTIEGLMAVRVLESEEIRTNVTLVFSPLQALMAAKAGASYVSPFVGRLDDIAQPGMDLVQDILTIYDNYEFATEVIVASIRNPIHAVEAALMGADIATIPFNVLKQFAQHPLTDKGIEKFLADWKKVQRS